jgi:hypothetical protein
VRLWDRLRRSPAPSANHAAWWTAAAAAADRPTAEAVAALRRGRGALADPDARERADEMLDGLDRVLALSGASDLPSLETQHRVIGADRCHFFAPASLAADVESAGKVFVTSARLVFAGPRVQAWPWHRITRLLRAERTLTVVVSGAADPPVLLCNSYGDALVIAHLASRLKR